MVKKLILSLLAFGLVACTDPSAAKDDVKRTWVDGYQIYYLYDARTKQCFATAGFGKYSQLAAVDCTEEVLKAIKQDQ